MAVTPFGSSIELIDEGFINTMNKFLIIIIAILLSQVTVSAEDYYYQCHKGEKLKTIAVTYNSRSNDVPCSVIYTKKNEAIELWQADKKQNYCESKASIFAENQVSKGWNCAKNMGKVPT